MAIRDVFKRRIFKIFLSVGRELLVLATVLFTSHKGISQIYVEFPLANLSSQIQANTLSIGEHSLRISLFFPLLPAPLP